LKETPTVISLPDEFIGGTLGVADTLRLKIGVRGGGMYKTKKQEKESYQKIT